MADDRIRSLDGLRALAVLAVILFHTTHVSSAFGAGGVRLFFVLSGFLITGILLKARDSEDRAYAWRAFYARRALRIFPLAYVVLALAWVAGIEAVRDHPASYALYLENWTMAREGLHLHTAHFWSLAVEEQFYLAWPLLMLWTPRRALLPLMIACVIVAGVYRIAESGVGASIATLARMDALACGAVLALVRVPSWVGLFGLGLLPFAITNEWGAVLLSGTAVQLAGQGPQAIRRALSWRPLVYVGTISYGVYVIHPFVPMLIRQTPLWRILPEYGLQHFAVVTSATILLASISWFLMEQPLNNLKRYVPYQRHRPTPIMARPRRVTARLAPPPPAPKLS